MGFPTSKLVKATIVIHFWRQKEKFKDRKTAIARIVFTGTNVFEGTAYIEGRELEKNYFVREGEINRKEGYFRFCFVNKQDKKITFYSEPEIIGQTNILSSQGACSKEGQRGSDNALFSFVPEEFRIGN